MNTNKENKDEMDDNSNVIDFSLAKDLARGGKGPPGKNWLAELDEGQVFYCRKKANIGQPADAMCMEYVVARKFTKVTLLYSDLNPPSVFIPVDTELFSYNAELVEVGEVRKNVLD